MEAEEKEPLCRAHSTGQIQEGTTGPSPTLKGRVHSLEGAQPL